MFEEDEGIEDGLVVSGIAWSGGGLGYSGTVVVRWVVRYRVAGGV